MTSHPTYGGGVSLANDLQNEHSVVGNFPDFLMLYHWGSQEQRDTFIPARLEGNFRQYYLQLSPLRHNADLLKA